MGEIEARDQKNKKRRKETKTGTRRTETKKNVQKESSKQCALADCVKRD